MKKLLLLTTVLSLAIPSFAQNPDEPKTIFDTEQINGFGQFDVKYSLIMDEPVLLLGGQGGLILNRHVLVGVSAHSMAYKVSVPSENPSQSLHLHMGYSGLLLGYIVAPVKVIHVSFPLTLGAGIASISNKVNSEFNNSSVYVDVENSIFLFAEPSVQLEINVMKFLKLSIGGSYRLNHSLELQSPVTSSDLNNWTGNVSIALGKF